MSDVGSCWEFSLSYYWCESFTSRLWLYRVVRRSTTDHVATSNSRFEGELMSSRVEQLRELFSECVQLMVVPQVFKAPGGFVSSLWAPKAHKWWHRLKILHSPLKNHWHSFSTILYVRCERRVWDCWSVFVSTVQKLMSFYLHGHDSKLKFPFSVTCTESEYLLSKSVHINKERDSSLHSLPMYKISKCPATTRNQVEENCLVQVYPKNKLITFWSQWSETLDPD